MIKPLSVVLIPHGAVFDVFGLRIAFRYHPRQLISLLRTAMKVVRNTSILMLTAALAVGCGKNDNAEPNNANNANNGEDMAANNGADMGPDNNGTDMGDAGADMPQNMEPWSPDCDITVWPGADPGANFEAIQAALLDVEEGGIVCISDGTYDLEEELSLNTANVEVRGQSQTGTILDFTGQTEGANGLSATSDGVVFSNLTVKNTPGDAIRVTGANGVTFRNLDVTWSGGPQTENGAYGLYPVQCQNVLIEGCSVSYASDAGIYVGQSMNVIVRDNEAFGNVAGIEIENTTGADVYDNHSYENTGGLLIFDLPGPPIQGGNSNKIHNNILENNNEPNFAEAGNIVSLVPAGTGLFILSSDSNEVHDNTITGNESLGVAVISWETAGQPNNNPEFDEFAEGNWVHDNEFSNNGTSPKGFMSLITMAAGVNMVEPLAWDGVVDATKDNSDGSLTNCFSGNTVDGNPAPFRNFNTSEGFNNQSTDIGENDCMHTPLPATVIEE